MTIFGLHIMREKTYREEHLAAAKLLEIAETELELARAKYYYAKARALVAEQFQRKTTVTVWPVAMGVDSGVRLEVGIKNESEITPL